jgi:hypothetical protein
MKLCDGNSETHLMQGDATWQKQFETLRRQLEQRWVAQPTKERRVIQSGIIEGKLFSIFDDGSIEIQTGSGIKQFKDFAELRAVAAANGQEGTGRTEPGRHSLQHPTLHDLVPHWDLFTSDKLEVSEAAVRSVQAPSRRVVGQRTVGALGRINDAMHDKPHVLSIYLPGLSGGN